MELMALQSKNFLQWWSGRQSRAQLVSDESQSVSVAHLLYFIFCYVYRSVGASMVRVWGFPVIVMYCCMSWYFFIVRKNFQVFKLQVDTIENIVGFFLESLPLPIIYLCGDPIDTIYNGLTIQLHSSPTFSVSCMLEPLENATI